MEIVSYAMGEGAGYDEGYTGGYNEGYSAGEASSTAYQDGYTAGEAAGYDEGYTAGSGLVKQLITARGGCRNLFASSSVTHAGVENLLKFSDTTGVEDFTNMFSGCNSLQRLPNLDYSSAKRIGSMFMNTLIGGNIDFSNTQLNEVGNAFKSTNILSAKLNLGSSVKALPGLFDNCANIKNIELSCNNVVLNGTEYGGLYQTFKNCKALETVTITGNLTTENNAILTDTFNNAFTTSSSEYTFPYFDTSKVSKFIRTFAFTDSGAQTARDTIPLYDFSSVTQVGPNYCSLMFFKRYIREIPNIQFPNMTDVRKESLFSGAGSDSESQNYYLFYGNTVLRAIHIKNINYNFRINVSTQFTREALIEIIGNLVDRTGTTAKTLTMGATNLAKLTAEDIAVATDKNWTIA